MQSLKSKIKEALANPVLKKTGVSALSDDQIRAEIARLKEKATQQKKVPKWCLSCDELSLNGKHLCNGCLGIIELDRRLK